MSIQFDSNNAMSTKAAKNNVAQTYGVHVAGKSREKELDLKKDEIVQQKDSVTVSKSEEEKPTGKAGKQSSKKTKGNEAQKKLDNFVKNEIFCPAAMGSGDTNDELYISPKEDLSNVYRKKPEDITGSLPGDVERASRVIVDKQFDVQTNRPTKELSEMKMPSETKMIDEKIEKAVSISDIHDKINMPIVMTV